MKTLCLLFITLSLTTGSSFAQSNEIARPQEIAQLEQSFKNFATLIKTPYPEFTNEKISLCFYESVAFAMTRKPEMKQNLHKLMERVKKSPQMKQISDNPTVFSVSILALLGSAKMLRVYDQEEALSLLANLAVLVGDVMKSDAQESLPSCQQSTQQDAELLARTDSKVISSLRTMAIYNGLQDSLKK